MKKIVSIALTLILILALPVSAFAATPEKYTDCKTNAEKISWLKSTYGITDWYEWRIDLVGKEGKEIEAKAIDRIQYAWSLVGQSTTKKIFNYYLKTIPEFDVSLMVESYDPNAFFHFNPKADVTFKIKASFDNGFIAPTSDAICATMYAFDLGMIEGVGAKVMAGINGKYTGYTNANQYVKSHAAASSKDDFAETCASMIVNGGDKPCKLGKDTLLYKKYDACYAILLDQFGAKSNAVIRSAAFLGEELPKE